MSRTLLFVALLVCSLSFISCVSFSGFSNVGCGTAIASFTNIGGFASNSTCAQRQIDDGVYMGYTITCTPDLTSSWFYAWIGTTSPVSCDGVATYQYSGTFNGTACITPTNFFGASSLTINCNSAAGLTVLSSLLVALVALVTKVTQWF